MAHHVVQSCPCHAECLLVTCCIYMAAEPFRAAIQGVRESSNHRIIESSAKQHSYLSILFARFGLILFCVEEPNDFHKVLLLFLYAAEMLDNNVSGILWTFLLLCLYSGKAMVKAVHGGLAPNAAVLGERLQVTYKACMSRYWESSIMLVSH